MALPELKLSELPGGTKPAALAIRRQWLAAGVLPLLVAAFVYSLLVVLGTRLLADPDTFFHIAAGKWIWAHGSVPTTDPFSFTMRDAPWTAHEWLAELIWAGSYAAFGWVGVVAIAAAAIAATYFLLARFLERVLPSSAMLLGVAASFMLASPHLLARPHVLTMPILLAWTIALDRSRVKAQAPSLLLLPLMTLWANLHGGFVIGLALIGVFALEALITAPDWPARRQAARQWSGFFLGAVLASLVTPYGVEGPLFAFHLSNQAFSLGFVNEWHSSDFGRFQPLEIWILGLLVLGFCLPLRLPLIKLLLLLGLIHLALVHRRNVELLSLIGPILLAEPLKRAVGDTEARITSANAPSRYYLIAALALAIATGMTFARGIVRDDQRMAPTRALAAATAAEVAGPVLNAYDFGGYLIFAGIAPFVDGRIDLYGDTFMHAYADAVSAKGEALEDTLERYRINWTLLQPNMQAIKTLDHLPGWERVYADDNAVIHRRLSKIEPTNPAAVP